MPTVPNASSRWNWLWSGGKIACERVREVVPEQGRPERDPGGQLAHHGRQPQPLRNLRPDARHRHQQRELHQQQEHGVAGQARDGSVQAGATVAWETSTAGARRGRYQAL